VLWESLSEEEKVKYWKILQPKKDGPNGVGITRERLTKGHKSLGIMSSGSSRVSVSRLRVTTRDKSKYREVIM
jgi:hypothetical protein